MQKKKKKIAILLPHLRPGGIEVASVKLANTLVDKGVDVCMVLGSGEGALIRELSSEIPVIVLRNRRAILSIREIRRVLQDLRIDVVYAGTNARNIVALLAVSGIRARFRPKIILSEHTSPEAYLAEAKLRGLRKWLMRRLYPRADLLVSPTEGLAAGWLRHLGLTQPPVATLPNPILDEQHLRIAARPVENTSQSRNLNQILCVGRLHPAKGQDVLIRAFAKALELRPEFELSLLGEGDMRGELERLVDKCGVSGKVQFCGYVPDVAQALARAGLLVVPSRREGFGNVVVEALVQGTPVVATDCPGPRALMSDAGNGGQIVPVGDMEALTHAMVDMAGNPNALTAARQAGQALIPRYSVAAAADAFAHQLDQLLEGRDV